MSSPLPPPVIEAGEDENIRMLVGFDVSAEVILVATPGADAELLAGLSLQISVGDPNLSIAALIGAALESAAAGQPEHAYLGLQAAVHLLAGVTASRRLGVIE